MVENRDLLPMVRFEGVKKEGRNRDFTLRAVLLLEKYTSKHLLGSKCANFVKSPQVLLSVSKCLLQWQVFELILKHI